MDAIATVSARVLIVEDNPEFLQFLLTVVGQSPNLVVAGTTQDGWAAVSAAQSLQPDVILLDIGLPGLNGIDVARRLRRLSPECKIIFVTQESGREIIEEARSIGARGYVLKSRAESDLQGTIVNVISGRTFVSEAAEPL